MVKKNSSRDNHNVISFRLPDSYLRYLEEHSFRYGLKSRTELAKILLIQAIEDTRSKEILTQISFLRIDIADALFDILLEGLDIRADDVQKLISRLHERGITPPESIR